MHLYTEIIDFTFIFLALNWNLYLYILCPALFLLLKWSAFYVSLSFTLFLSLSVSLLLSLYRIETAFISLRLNRFLYLLLKSFAMSYESIWRIRYIYLYTCMYCRYLHYFLFFSRNNFLGFCPFIFLVSISFISLYLSQQNYYFLFFGYSSLQLKSSLSIFLSFFVSVGYILIFFSFPYFLQSPVFRTMYHMSLSHSFSTLLL